MFEKLVGRASLAGENGIDERALEVPAWRRHSLRFGRDRFFGGRIGTIRIAVAWLGLFRNQRIQDQQAARPHDFSPDKAPIHDS